MRKIIYIAVLACTVGLLACADTSEETESISSSETKHPAIDENVETEEWPETDMSVKSEEMYLADLGLHPLYAAFLRNELSVANPYVADEEGNPASRLTFFDERDYAPESIFETPRKSFSLADVNHDGNPELVFRIEDSPSKLMYILGVLNDELICYDVFETHTSHMGFNIYDNGNVYWGQNYDGDETVFYTYTDDGKPSELIHFVREGESESYGDYDYYYLDGDESTKYTLQGIEEYEELEESYRGGEPEWFACEWFADIPEK